MTRILVIGAKGLMLENRRALRRERYFRQRLSPLDSLTNEEIKTFFRFDRRNLMRLIDSLEVHLSPATIHNRSINRSIHKRSKNTL
jgi:hypothetical protein